MAGTTGLSLAGLLCMVFIALVASFLLNPEDNSPPALYCIADPNLQYITTLNSSLPKAKCFRVQHGVFTDVLGDVPNANDKEEITWLDGYILPGLIDSHGHILAYGEMLESVSLYGVKSVDEMRTRIKTFVNDHKGEGYGTREKWIRGIGWDQANFGGVMPTADELAIDPELSDLYMMLDRVDVHCVLASRKVLDLLPNPLPESPPGGVIVMDPGPGVFCDNAMDAIIFPLAPKPDVAQKSRWVKSAMSELNKVGIVGVGDAGMRPDEVAILESMAEKGELSIRINVMLECRERNAYCPLEVNKLKLLDQPRNFGGNMLMLGGVKLFADGALGSWGAALLEPYSDKPETSGSMLINETVLTRVVKDWFDAGFQVNIHAIGDRANRAAVDAFEEVLGPNCNNCNSERRLRIEHAQIIHPEDQQRIAKLGIIPSIQPTHATSDMAYALDRLGESRLGHSAYRMQGLFPPHSSKPGYHGPVLGSDFPVEPADPFSGMFAAVTRLSPSTHTSPSGEGGWYPEERLSIEQALRGFTENAAYGWFKEGSMGGIQVGMLADWVVVDRDVMDDKTGRLLTELNVRQTWVGGSKVYDSYSAYNGGISSSWIKWLQWLAPWAWEMATALDIR